MEKPVIPVTVKGRYFWRGDKRFMVNGVVYQLGKTRSDGSRIHLDPLADEQLETLQRSVSLFKELRLNTLFILYIDETKCHDAAMDLLAEAGIYVLIDAQCLCGQRRDLSCHKPSATYTPQLLASCFRAVDVMASYPNTLGLIVANEFISSLRVTSAAPFLRALTRDIKKYMTLATKQGQRVLPVGVSAADISHLLKTQLDYFSAGSDEEAIDFFAFNNFDCVGQWFMIKSGTTPLADMFSSAHIPVFFSQYSSAETRARPFFDTRSLYTNDEMLRVFSGGMVYEFFDGPGRFGLVRHGTTSHGTVSLKKQDDFASLQLALNEFFPPRRLEQRTAKLQLLTEEDEPLDPSYTVISRRDIDVSSVGATTVFAGGKPPMPRRTYEWQASHEIPEAPIDWAALEAQIDEKIMDDEWTDVQADVHDMAVDDLTFGIRDKLIIDDDSQFIREDYRDYQRERDRTCKVI
ncbi:hypothetical protein Hte_003595 [Hypoxylon texense]